jgi:hypothetical protein
MAILFWIIMILVASFDVIGLIEGVKSISAAVMAKKGLAWPVLSVVLSAVVAVFLGNIKADIFGSTLNAILFAAVTIFAFIELIGYNVIVKWVFTIVDAAIKKIDPDISGGLESDLAAGKPHTVTEDETLTSP